MEKQENGSIFWVYHARKSETDKKRFFYHQSVKIQLSGLQMSPIPSLGLNSKAGKSIFKTHGMHGFERRNVERLCFVSFYYRRSERGRCMYNVEQVEVMRAPPCTRAM